MVLDECLANGLSLLIEPVDEVDPMLDNILNNNTSQSGSLKLVMLGGREAVIADGFNLYLRTNEPNPVFSQGMQTKTALIDFSVTVKGLEDQLLGRVIELEMAQVRDRRC